MLTLDEVHNIAVTLVRALLTAVFGFTLSASASAQQIAFTWDDLPAHSALPLANARKNTRTLPMLRGYNFRTASRQLRMTSFKADS